MDCDSCHVPIRGVVHRVGNLTYCNGCNRDILARAVKETRARLRGHCHRSAMNAEARRFIRAMQGG